MSQILLLKQDGRILGAFDRKPFGYEIRGNPLSESSLHARSAPPESGPNLVFRSGTLEHPHHTWGSRGHEAFLDLCQRLSGNVCVGQRVLFRPHHEDVLSDIQRCLAFVRDEQRRQVDGMAIAFDPVGLLAPSMMASAPDHLSRWAEAIHGVRGFGLLMLCGLGAPDSSHASAMESAFRWQDDQGKAFRPLVDAWAASGSPIVLCEAEFDVQTNVLRSWGLKI